MRQQRISLHLAETDASAKFAAFDRLVSQCIDWPRRPHLQQQGMANVQVLDSLPLHQATRSQSKGLAVNREQKRECMHPTWNLSETICLRRW